jgi:photosystem II stability/assembly factor-like uncharacterized protein
MKILAFHMISNKSSHMKNNLFLLLFIFPLALFCQWTKTTVSTSKNLNAIAFSSSTSGVIVGDSGTILKTGNTGTSYSAISSGTNKNLKDVKFIAGSAVGVAVGNSGTILLSTNSGSSWNSITSPSANDLNAIAFFNSSNGIIVGNNGTVLKTINAGSSWTNVTPVTIYLLNKVLYLSATEIIACGANGTIIKSVNGGDNWTLINASTTRYLTDVIVENDSLIFIGDKGFELKTSKTFTQIKKDSLCSEQLRSINCINNNCIAVGKNAKIMAAPKGENRSAVAVNYNNNFNEIQFINDTTAIIVGDNGIVLKTVTGGISNAVSEIEPLHFTVYPNPTQGDFNIALNNVSSKKINLQIINSTGSVLLNEYILNENIIHISQNLSSGIYLLKISDGERIRIQKISVY